MCVVVCDVESEERAKQESEKTATVRNMSTADF